MNLDDRGFTGSIPQLYERYTDEDSNLLSRPVILDGEPVESREAIDIRDRLIERHADEAFDFHGDSHSVLFGRDHFFGAEVDIHVQSAKGDN